MTDDISAENDGLYDGQEETFLSAVCEGGGRFDVVLTELFPESIESRSRARKLIDGGLATVNGKTVKAGASVQPGSIIEASIPPAEIYEALPENIPLDVIYEDRDIIVVNKPRGMVVHPAAGNHNGTLVNALLHHCGDLSEIGGVIRPGIVHRIDRDTTGLIVAAKNNTAHLVLSEELRTREMHRIYLAAAEGMIKEESGVIDAPIGRSPKDRKKMAVVKNGRTAVTYFEKLASSGTSRTTLLRLSLDTGRTHQIRVHLSYKGHPVVGDHVYGYKNTRGMEGQALHAGKLILRHPATGEEMCFSCKPPEDFLELIRKLGLEEGEERFLK